MLDNLHVLLLESLPVSGPALPWALLGAMFMSFLTFTGWVLRSIVTGRLVPEAEVARIAAVGDMHRLTAERREEANVAQARTIDTLSQQVAELAVEVREAAAVFRAAAGQRQP